MAKEANPGFAGGIAKRSAIQRLAWQLKGAPPRKKDLRLSAIGAIAEARKLRDRVTAAMHGADADPEDARVYCVFAEPQIFEPLDLEALGDDAAAIGAALDAELDAERPAPKLARLRVKNGASDLKLAAEFVEKLPLGFLIFVWDRSYWARNDPHAFVEWSIRPLMVEDQLANTTISAAMRAEKKRMETRLRQTGGVLADDEDLVS